MKTILSIILSLAFSLSLSAKNGFAIVVDPASYQAAKTEIDAYASSVETINNYKVYMIVDYTGVPDSIRQRLKYLHQLKQAPIVGTVLIGDIPVPMIRDAQFLTSAFKMDQRRDHRESSVPSDRYYDTFGLDFKPLGKDKEKPYFYYSLTSQGAISLHSDIFSGRIRPTDANGVPRIDKLKAYLRKVVVEKSRRMPFKNLFFFSGHGYISDSKVARMDEKISYYEHFPMLKGNRYNISYMDHTDAVPVKERLMNELMRTDLSLAVLHHHGNYDTQYLNGLAPIRTVKEAKEFIIRNARKHVYTAKKRGKNADSIRTAISKRFDLPVSWLADAMSDSLAISDSLYDAMIDLHLEDFRAYGYRPNVPVVVIDACFCGSFHLDNCIANEYIFQPGSTVAVMANTVNVLQDKWSDRFIGLIAEGGTVGQLAQLSSLLESHIIGDPTFGFPSDNRLDVAGALTAEKVSTWKKLLKTNLPEIQATAINQLVRLHAIGSDRLYDLIKTSPYGIVRLESFLGLASLRDENFIKAIEYASQDSYELLQRQAIRFMSKSGDHRLIPSLITLAIANNTSDRCNFNVMNALSTFPQEALLAEFERQFNNPAIQFVRKDSVYRIIRTAIENSSTRMSRELEKLFAPQTKQKEKIFALRAMRNTLPHHLVPRLLDQLSKETDTHVQQVMLEALGWHPYSVQAKAMAEKALAISKDSHYGKAVREEAAMTYKRLNEQ